MDEFKKYFQDHRSDLDTDLPGDELWQGVKKTLHPKPAFPLYLKWIAAACIVIVAGTAAFFFGNKKTDALAEQSGTKPDSLIHQAPEPTHDQLVAAPLNIDSVNTGMTSQQFVNKAIMQPSQKRQAGQEIRSLSAKERLARTNTRAGRNTAKPRYGFEDVEASYASMLNVQLEQIRTQPIYGENAAYFDLFKHQFKDLNKEEEKLKKEFKRTDDKLMMLDALILVYQQKISILKQLQFEINKMNSKVKQTDTGVPMQQPSYIHL
ncbi:MAG: hypothetical protein DI535_07475 [Citrobacter freundii]|nr:MAG: hypothetical protein DI535_07475 [Citrobacter freundii]